MLTEATPPAADNKPSPKNVGAKNSALKASFLIVSLLFESNSKKAWTKDFHLFG